MKDIGEYSSKQEILLELLTYDEQSNHISTDSLPIALIARYSADGFQEVAHVTLEEVKKGVYVKMYEVPESLSEGTYLVTYKAIIDSDPYEDIEKFTCIKSVTQKSSDKILVSDLTMTTGNGYTTTVVIAGGAVEGATVQAISVTGEITSTITDKQGHWNIYLYEGTYQIKFFHPNGSLLRTLEKVVY